VPDPQARGLAFRKSFLIGLVYDNPNAQVHRELHGRRARCRAQFRVRSRRASLRSQEAGLHRRRAAVSSSVQKLRGVILMPPISENDELTRALTAADCAYVRISYTALDDPARMVISNDRSRSPRWQTT
jgi:LacI family transcriptional regulator